MHEKNKSIIFAFYFFVTLFCVIFVVLVFRFVKLWNASSFDGVHQFVLGTQGHDPTEVIIFRPDTQQIDWLIFKGESNSSHLFSSAGVFVDGIIHYDHLLDPADQHLDLYLKEHLYNTKATSLNNIDFLRLLIFEKSIKPNKGNKVVFTLPLSQSANMALAQIITDKALYQEGKTVAVVNASTIYGEGSSVASALINIGVNVISVTTADNTENKSYISFLGKPNYTLLKLSRITHIPINSIQSNNKVADITIMLGQDIQTRLNTLQ